MKQIRKWANAFYTNIEPSETVKGIERFAIDRYLKKHGGLWVGGYIIIDSDGATFIPNSFNRNMHKNLHDIHVQKNTVESIQYKFGWFTGIINLHHQKETLSFRCFGAEKLAMQLNQNWLKE